MVSDHGEEFLEHGAIGHHFSLYSEVNDVAAILHGPGLGTQRVSEEVSLIDIGPTLLELAGLEPPAGIDGLSLVPLLRGGAGATELSGHLAQRPVFAHRWADQRHLWSVVLGGWKLIHSPVGDELFHIAEDPDEREPVTDRFPEKAAELRELIEGYKERDYQPDSLRKEVPLSDATLEELKKLGYISDESDL